ncbi:MAG: zf-HC2 domain-containing protein [Acidobacteria bacterium]|nr:zf-HC2 domain-containing protein [Acidobacteriota bacterium]
MTCNTLIARLDRLLEGDLPGAESREAEAHLEGCAACREAVRQARATVEACRRAPRPAVDPGCLERAVRAAREELVRRGVLRKP